MTDTSKREELIEEAAKAMYFEDCGVAALEDDAEPFRDMARVAFAVFEQAHTPTDKSLDITLNNLLIEDVKPVYTPTDDEREYDRDMAVMLSQLVDDEPMWSCVVIAKKLHAAGFRRTAVQEPSAEEVDESAPRYQPCHFDTSGMYVRTWCHTHGYDHLTPDGDVYVQGFDLGDGKTYTGPVSQEDLFGVEPQGEPKHDASCGERCNHCQECGTGITYGSRCPDHYLNQSQGEPTDAPTVQLAARRGGKVQAMIDSMLAQANERGIRVEVVYPQGEPERGAVERAVDAFVSAHDEMGESLHDSMRAALTAAYETKGENRG